MGNAGDEHLGEAVINAKEQLRYTTDRLEVPSLIGNSLPPPDTKHRAVHQIRLSALTHNYNCVEAAANRQKCAVIVVVKADGYGHGAISTAIHLADSAGAEAFAVATLEEAITLRKAFETTPVGGAKDLVNGKATPVPAGKASTMFSSFFQPPDDDGAETVLTNGTTISQQKSSAINKRSNNIRILVLGPAVGYPRCFDDYYYYNIELVVSGPEVAKALMAWVADPDERKRTIVERAATESKTKALLNKPNDAERKEEAAVRETKHSATLSTVSGQDLVNEVRTYLMSQDKLKLSQPNSRSGSGVCTPAGNAVPSVQNSPKGNKTTPISFAGIEAAANSSRTREKAVKANKTFVEESTDVNSYSTSATDAVAGRAKRVLRWHADVESGMGRLGFTTEPIPEGDPSGQTDTVTILRELVDAEVSGNAPLEFYGMCTHMAEANSESTYTSDQIERFKGLLKRVRDAGISLPTVSTDNSAALLTTTLTHFDPDELLSQPDVPTRGFVRTGGAIYGQRPAFTQLQAVSTLKVAVRHVAVLREGDSVGYDRAYIAPHDVRIATLTIGFADGYPRELGNGVGMVSIRGETFPIAGNVCMDMLMVDLGPVEDLGVGADVVVGDVAVLWGPEEGEDGYGLVKLQDIAARLRTTQSALTCGLDKIRVNREVI
jgi:alanine racemase